jgi:electron transport complex protein RnfC
MLKSLRTFRGGFRFKNYAGQAQPILQEAKIPAQVIIPLRQGFGTEVKPLVKIGDSVFAGQVIGRDDQSISSPIHSSVNGIVEGIKRMNYFKREITMVLIRTTNSSSEIPRLIGHSAEWGKLTNAQIEELIY